VEEIGQLPANEILDWMEYFEIYPFTQDREDLRTARLCATIANVSGRVLTEPLGEETFLPDYLGIRTAKPKELTLEEQRRRDIAFGNQLRALEAAKRGEHES
jgi:hypothetical protein